MKKITITIEHSKIILEKMFDAIGLRYSEEFVAQPDWYTKFDWIRPEYKESFLTWLTQFLVENKYASKQRARHEAEKINAVYGWKELASQK